MTSLTDSLRGCPFCGHAGKPKQLVNTYGIAWDAIECVSCGAAVAAYKWNDRYETDIRDDVQDAIRWGLDGLEVRSQHDMRHMIDYLTSAVMKALRALEIRELEQPTNDVERVREKFEKHMAQFGWFNPIRDGEGYYDIQDEWDTWKTAWQAALTQKHEVSNDID